MKNIMAAALWAGILIQVVAQAFLWERLNRLEQEPKREKPEESQSGTSPDYWEKLWAKGLEGIMSYGVADALGRRGGGE